MSNKEFKTLEEQIEILQNRNLVISDITQVKELLKKENYYKIINGYKDLFLQKNSDTEIYIENTNFMEVYSLYSFDRKLRNLFFGKILIIENNLKSAIAYDFSKLYGQENYLKLSNFENEATNKKRDIIKLIAIIQGNIANQVKKNDSITHYLDKYGFIPLWVLVNVLTFGTISKFYSLMKQSDRVKISKIFKCKENELLSFIEFITLFRNISAHEERMYTFKSKKIIVNTNIHSNLKLKKNNGNYIHGKNDLFGLLIVLKILLDKNDFEDLFTKLKFEIDELSKKLNVITIEDVFKKMGFPSNWEKIINL